MFVYSLDVSCDKKGLPPLRKCRSQCGIDSLHNGPPAVNETNFAIYNMSRLVRIHTVKR